MRSVQRKVAGEEKPMRFNPIVASQAITDTYKSYIKSTFFIKDDAFREAYYEELDVFNFANGPYLEVVDAFEQSRSLKDLVEEGLLSPLFPKLLEHDREQYTRPLYSHQEDAVRVALSDRNMVVTTGTGSGKTECFLYPILHHLLEEERKKTLCPGVRVLLLYPMNALANDQMKRLRTLLAKYPAITFGAYTGETEQTYKKAQEVYKKLHDNEEPLPNELICRDQMKEQPPHILVTNYAMLEYLLLRPTDTVFFDDIRFGTFWKYIVLDEAHVYAGASGMEVSILLRRLLYRLQNPKKIRFILTSATLGGEDENDSIIHFASALCANREFTSEAIIRAKRRSMDFEPRFEGSVELYRALAEKIGDQAFKDTRTEEAQKRELLAILDHHPGIGKDLYQVDRPIQEILYDVFSRDHLYQWIRSQLAQGSKSLEELGTACPVPIQSLIDFITIASYAIKHRGKLLDSRYHHFIRTLEGAYITFSPKKTLSLTPKRTALVDGVEYRTFKLSVCQYCGELYLEGRVDGRFFSQEEGMAKKPYLVLRDGFSDFNHDDLDQLAEEFFDAGKEYRLCVRCGQTARSTEQLQCGCSAPFLSIREIKARDEGGLLHSCAHCQSINPKGSILRGFYLGQDASTAVVGSALFEQIPETTIRKRRRSERENPFGVRGQTEKEPKKTRQVLLFSDSRQEAAYFAPYFKYTYDVVYHRRVMMASARTLYELYPETYETGIPVRHLMDEMERYYETAEGKKLSPAERKKTVWTAVVAELMDMTRNSLHSVGLLHYSLPEETLHTSSYTIGEVEITSDEFNTILQFIFEYCMDHGALFVDKGLHLQDEDWKEITYSPNEPFIISHGSEKNSKSIVSSRNAIALYLQKALTVGKDDTEVFLDQLFEYYLKSKSILVHVVNNPGKYKVNPDNVLISLQEHRPKPLYRCSVCGRITTMNLRGVCPAYRCTGNLNPFDLFESDVKDYFVGQYGPESLIYPIEVKEHTAQLSKEQAANYQQRFIEGSINVLSCSTTFEMGVDVGELETVFMKNVPPRPSNYIQRAGRAGRRLDSAAFALTFCRLSPHDFYYYSRPEQMINGRISPPVFKVDNPKIVRRHVFAVLLSWYWRSLGAEITTVNALFDENGLEEIQAFLTDSPPEMLAYLERVVPSSLRQSIPTFIEEYREEVLPEAYRQFLRDIQEYKDAYTAEDQKDAKKKNHDLLGWLTSMQRTYESETIIPFYSRNNLIPKYGFPVDTVTLFTHATSSYKNTNSSLSLQRDLTQAISEYAPDSEVIADGYLYRSRYIKKPIRAENEWKEQLVSECGNPGCNLIRVENYTGQSVGGRKTCPSCGLVTVQSKIMIIPDSGFIIAKENEKVRTKRPQRSSRTEFYYLGTGQEQTSAKQYHLGANILSVISSPDDELLVMNQSDFYICRRCGYSVRRSGGPFIKKSHLTPKDAQCGNTRLEKRSLGHVFKTDVALINVNHQLSSERAITILYALLSGCSEYYDVERNDIDGCISYQSYGAEGGLGGLTFVLFDSVPGGAGNVKRIYDSDENTFKEYLKACLNIVESCDCGTDGDAVCYRCLCTFKNQMFQERMQRRYAIDFLKDVMKER